MNLYELHERMTGHLFPAYSNTDERFLALALCGEAGELANMIKKRWRDGEDAVPLENILDELADIRVYLELLAKRFGVEGWRLDQRVEMKLEKVITKHGLNKPRKTSMPGRARASKTPRWVHQPIYKAAKLLPQKKRGRL